MILIEWVSKNGKKRRLCIGKGCGSLPPLGQDTGTTDSNTIISVQGKYFSNNAAIQIDRNYKYGFIGEQPSELIFENPKTEKNLVELNEIMIEFKDSKERLSVLALISIIENNQEENIEVVCGCTD